MEDVLPAGGDSDEAPEESELSASEPSPLELTELELSVSELAADSSGEEEAELRPAFMDGIEEGDAGPSPEREDGGIEKGLLSEEAEAELESWSFCQAAATIREMSRARRNKTKNGPRRLVFFFRGRISE